MSIYEASIFVTSSKQLIAKHKQMLHIGLNHVGFIISLTLVVEYDVHLRDHIPGSLPSNQRTLQMKIEEALRIRFTVIFILTIIMALLAREIYCRLWA
jgi:hypothetical protein